MGENKSLKNIAADILLCDSALIFCHTRPDGDTLGGAMALCLGLRQKGMRADVVCDGAVPQKYSYEPFFKEVLTPEKVISAYACHIAVDVASENMLGTAYGVFSSSKNTFCIDHHVSNTRYAREYFVRDCAANCLNIGELLTEAGVCIKDKIAEALLLGLITDTGNFSQSNTSEEALIYAGKLVSLGADVHKINYYMFKNQTKARAKLHAEVMQKMRFFSGDKIAIITISKDDLNKSGAGSEQTEGFVDFPLSIEGVEVACSLLETKNELYKVSLRSKGKINVNAVAGEFGGGGHVLASGCVISGPYEEVVERLVRAIVINSDF